MQGPITMIRSEGRHLPSEHSALIPAGTIPSSVPFFPEWRRAPADPSCATNQTGAQSATEIPSVIPLVVVTRASTPGIGNAKGCVTRATSEPWICSAVTNGKSASPSCTSRACWRGRRRAMASSRSTATSIPGKRPMKRADTPAMASRGGKVSIFSKRAFLIARDSCFRSLTSPLCERWSF